MNLTDSLKRIAEIIGATVVIYTAVAGVLVALGAHLPPWSTVAEAQAAKQEFQQYKASQAQQTKQTSANVDLLTFGLLMDEATDANREAALHPRDSAAHTKAVLKQMQLKVFLQSHPWIASQMRP